MTGFAVCGTGSGVGKTTIAAGLMAALSKRGLRVQPFKCGPDFIDPGHHTGICRRPSHNLDTWMLSPEANRQIFAGACRDADVAVVEGMMGMFDGVGAQAEQGSSAEITKLLGLPVILVVDASSVARSVAAVVHGFQTFDPQVRIAGVILNRVAGPTHARLLMEALKSLDRDLMMGWIPAEPGLGLRERHLGLETAQEGSWSRTAIDQLAALIEENVSLDQILAACTFELACYRDQPAKSLASPTVRIGIARDRAFCFYYEAALTELRRQGAELIEFSPLTDSHLPDDLHGLYIGGGYPELYAEALSANTSLIDDLRQFAESGHPVYGECGGLMFLSHKLVTLDGTWWPMANLIPLSIEMTDKPEQFGYVEILFREDGLAPRGTCLRGHSFHYSRIVEEGEVQKKAVVHYSLSGESLSEGYTAGTVFGSYIHLHFAAAPALVTRFIAMARDAERQRVRP